MFKAKYLSGPYLLWAIIFVIIPLGLVFFFSFTNESGAFTFDNIIATKNYLPTMLLSFRLAIISTIICLVISYPLSYIISRAKAGKQNIFIMLIMLPMWMNFLLRTYGWMTILEDKGTINSILTFLNIAPLHMINTEGAVILGMVYNYLPFMVLPLYSIMVKIDESTIEAAQDLGANPTNVLRKVILPLSLPGIFTGITMVFVPSVSTFMISRMLGGGSNMMIGDLIENQFIGSAYNPYLGSALSLVLMAIILVVMGIINRFDNEDMEGMLI